MTSKPVKLDGKKSRFSIDVLKQPTLKKTRTECLIHINYKSNYSLLFLKICQFNWKLKSDFMFLLSLSKSTTTVLSGWGEQWQTISIWAVGKCWANMSSLYMAVSFQYNLVIFICMISLYTYVIVLSDGFSPFLCLFSPTLGRQIKWIKEKWKKKFPGFKIRHLASHYKFLHFWSFLPILVC